MAADIQASGQFVELSKLEKILENGDEKLVEIGKFKLHLSPIDDASSCELDRYVRSRIIQVAEEATQDMHPSVRQEILTLAVRQASVASYMSEEGLKFVSTPDGMAVLTYYMARKHHANDPNVTIESLRTQMLSADNIRRINASYGDLNLPPETTAKKKKVARIQRNKKRQSSKKKQTTRKK